MALRSPLLDAIGIEHGFGLRDAVRPDAVLRTIQVHGTAVADAESAEVIEADAIVSSDPAHPVGIVTADCVPILACSAEGRSVVAIHVGWRGLAAGVVVSAIEALAQRDPGTAITAVIGPHIGSCCYEVDAPVVDALRERFGAETDNAIQQVRVGHRLLDLAALVEVDLQRLGVKSRNRGRIPDSCTFCNPERFHSYRRDGSESGRLLHHIRAKRGS